MGDYLFIDIRKSDEVYSRRFDKSYNYDVYYIPMYMIRFNVDMIRKHINYKKEIYIVCNSATRSQFIKNKYFANDRNIIVSDSLQFNNLSQGHNNVVLNNNNTIKINVIGDNQFNLYNIMRITQIILGSLIIIIGGYTLYSTYSYKNINKIPLVILILFGTMALFNGITSTCTISTIFVDSLN
jgi:hypothetical protein